MSERIPDEVIESVKRNSSFRSLLTGYGIEATKRGKNYFITCPFHDVDGKPESVPSCSIDIKGNLYYCFSCKAGGNIIQFVMAYEKVPFFEAVNKLLSIKSTPSKPIHKDRDRSGTAPNPEELPKLSESEEQKIFIEVIKQTTEALRSSSVARTYLKGRGLDPLHLLEHYELGFWSPELFSDIDKAGKDKLKALGFYTENDYPLFTNCVLWPLYIMNRGKVHTFYGRKTVGTGTHYQLTDRRGGMCLPKAGLNPRLPVVITESIIDGLSLFTAGITNVLPLCGTNAFHTNHSDYLKEKHFPKVFIAFNGDTPGKRGAAALSERLTAENFPVTVLELPEKKDINDLLTEWGAEKLGTWFKERIQPPEEPRPTVWEDELYKYILIGTHEYRVRGLTAQSLDRLRVNLKVYDVNDKDRFYIDSLDLYQSRSRETFIRQLQMTLENCTLNQITEEVNVLITTLEELRLILCAQESGSKKYEMSEEERQEALAYLRAPNLLDRIAADFQACGMVGNRNNCLLAYLGALSRLTDKPFGTLIVSRSGAGKSYLQDMITSFNPEEDVLQMTRLTGQSLFYQGKEGLKHRLLSIEEDEGMQDAMYAIRTLLSSQKLCVQSVRPDNQNGSLQAYENVVYGPASVMISTTNYAAFDHESVSRFFVLFLDESPEQTTSILNHTQKMAGIEGLKMKVKKDRILKRHRNIQRLLRPISIVNELGIGIKYPAEIIHTRREIRKVEALVSTVALLHQYQREIKEVCIGDVTVEYIEVAKEDIDMVHELGKEVFNQALDDLSKLCRDLLEHIHGLVAKKHQAAIARREQIEHWQITFSRKELQEYCHWSRWHLSEHLHELVNAGYILPKMGKKGQRYTYSLVDEILPCSPNVERT